MEYPTLSYSTEDLVKRAYSILSNREKKKLKLVPPEIIIKDRKTIITNFDLFCQSINRDKNIVKSYLDKETNFSSSFFGDTNQVKIDTVLKGPYVKNILTVFIKSYVICADCKSYDTQLIRQKRATYTQCLTCKTEKVLNIF
jgi:translation initiation factor 2 beta subunit (eIF-2beta)/eIF-5